MNFPRKLAEPLRRLVHDLVVGAFTELESDGRAGRLTADQLRQALKVYPATLIELPDEALESADAYEVVGDANAWAIDLDLWTAEEGRSDLTLEVTARVTPGEIELAIDDLHAQ